jgi:hypothetical protein
VHASCLKVFCGLPEALLHPLASTSS